MAFKNGNSDNLKKVLNNLEPFANLTAFEDDFEAMNWLSGDPERLQGVIDNHIKKLHKKHGLKSIYAFRDEYQKRLKFVCSKLESSSNTLKLESCKMLFEFIIDRAYYWENHYRQLTDGRAKYTKAMKREAKEYYQAHKEIADEMASNTKATTWVRNNLIPHLAEKFDEDEAYFNDSTFAKNLNLIG